ncbi:MAG TPA: glycoside hydrolase family 27 protein [Bacteroidota bacterium]|nr:glycoside hydrolase family 27 protein [Bacteroidota bacterium]
MKSSRLRCVSLMLFLAVCVRSNAQDAGKLNSNTGEEAAPTPPMGWNSYDAFGSNVTEAQFRSEVDFLRANLLSHGWKYAVVDYLWFNPTGGPNIHLRKNGEPIDSLAMDEFGRLLPAVNRFPSAAGSNGFKPLAEYVHGMGLKFGIHIMRGIPRQAYWKNMRILGTTFSAREAADTLASGLCPWNDNMYGLDPERPGSQAYYNSIFNLYAQWGVDFIKVDDIARPYHKGEIEMIRKAIDQCGRPMVLSLSPGETPLSEGQNVSKNASMWRIADDMWDSWKDLRHNFDLLNSWTEWRKKGHWPDADMLPIGHVSLNGSPNGPDRLSRFTKEETYTLLTLWCIARSPLIMGGELLTTPQWVIALLQNSEVIAVDQHSTENRQVMKNDSDAVWMGRDPATGKIYVALFNLLDQGRTIEFKFVWVPDLKGPCLLHDLWNNRDIGSVEKRFTITVGAHGAGLFSLTQQ